MSKNEQRRTGTPVPPPVAATETDPPPAPPETDKPVQEVEAKPAALKDAQSKVPPQKPSIGRVVHYTPPGASAVTKEGQPYPAIITHVNTDGTVNLHVFNDGRNRLNSTGLPTNVDEYVPGPEAPPEGGFWFWPPRV